MKTKFYNKNGQLSAYAFACGYVQGEEKNNLKKELYQEHSVYHFKVLMIDGPYVTRLVWDSFESLTEARRAYNKYKI